MYDTLTTKEQIIEFLIAHQPIVKKEVAELEKIKKELILRQPHVFRMDLEDQYSARIKQWISFYVADYLGLPAEYVIVEIEKIELEDYLSV